MLTVVRRPYSTCKFNYVQKRKLRKLKTIRTTTFMQMKRVRGMTRRRSVTTRMSMRARIAKKRCNIHHPKS